MIIVMKNSAEEKDIDHVIEEVEKNDLKVHLSRGVEKTIIGIIGDERVLEKEHFESLPGVQEVMPILKPYKMASRDFHPENTVIDVDGVPIGGNDVVIMAGPCSVESELQLRESAQPARAAGAAILRGGAFKPRTSPYSFQGLGKEGLELLRKIGDETGMKVITEVMAADQLEMVCEYADILQIGARNMQNYNLLQAVGETEVPVLLKRGFSSKIDELLLASEYILSAGNLNVMLCERGIRSFDSKYTRNVLDINAVPVLKELSHLPVIVDPSHATGKWELVSVVSRAAIAAGADGLIIEVHVNPDKALSDGRQSLNPETFDDLMKEMGDIAKAIGRSVYDPSKAMVEETVA